MGKRTYDLTWRVLLSTTTRGHRVLDRVSRGRLGRHFPGGTQVVWLTTLGRRSGQWRRTPLLSVRDGGDPPSWVVAGSNAGQARVPGWVFNVRDHAAGRLEIAGRHWLVTVEETAGEDRDRMYARLAASWRAFTSYERHAERYIPVFRIVLGDAVSPGAPLPTTPPGKRPTPS